jgi:uncharacterized protein
MHFGFRNFQIVGLLFVYKWSITGQGRLRPLVLAMIAVLVIMAAGNGARAAIAEKTLLWEPGALLRVCFFGGDTRIRSRIAAVALEWTKHANIRFDFGDLASPRSCEKTEVNEIRVGFSGSGYWAQMGTNNIRFVPQSGATVNLQGFDAETPHNEEFFRTVVLHQFGHVLGLQHEHQSPSSPCENEINWQEIYSTLASPPYFWSKEQVDQNLRSLPKDRIVVLTKFDPTSVMMYELPTFYFKKGAQSVCKGNPGGTLSVDDIAGIVALYPAGNETGTRVLEPFPKFRKTLVEVEIFSFAGQTISSGRLATRAAWLAETVDLSPEIDKAVARIRDGIVTNPSHPLSEILSRIGNRDYAVAREELEKMSAEGNGEAALLLAHFYLHGYGVQQDRARMVTFVRAAADHGAPIGQFLIGLFYHYGFGGVRRDDLLATNWLTKAAESGIPEAAIILGDAYADGTGVTRHYQLASDWYRKAIDQGLAAAQYKLAIMYDQGLGLEQNAKEAFRLAKAAHEGRDSAATFFLALLYADGIGIAKDTQKAVELIKAAAQRDYSIALTALGYIYEVGNSVPQDLKEAAANYSRAAELGDATAQYRLASLYENGSTVNGKADQLVSLYQKAAASGHVGAQFKLGLLYKRGFAPLAQDLARAYSWLDIAAFNASNELKKSALSERDAIPLSREQWAEARRFAASWASAQSDEPGQLLANEEQRGGDLHPFQSLSPKASGSGVLISKTGHILTNSHVVRNCVQIEARLGSASYRAKLIAEDTTNDMAVVQLANHEPGRRMEIRANPIRAPGKIIVAGFPLVGLNCELPGSCLSELSDPILIITSGSVSSSAGKGNDTTRFIFSASAHKGSSGGPIVDENGRLAGIVVEREEFIGTDQKKDSSTPLLFGIKASLISEFLSNEDVDFSVNDSQNLLDEREAEKYLKGLTAFLVCYG